jgi:glycosyltransferase involved in cell wall biosynthesis
MGKMMRILYVTNGFPFPLTSGYLRHYFLIKELSQRHSITLLSFVPAGFDGGNQAALEPYTEALQVIRRRESNRGITGKFVHAARLAAGVESATRQMRSAVARLSSRQPFDLAVLSGKHTLPVLDEIPDVPVVADICDAASVRIRGKIRVAGRLEVPILSVKLLWMRRLERCVLRRAAHAVFASGRDRDALTRPSNPQASIVPNGVDLDYWRPARVEPGSNRIIFTGAMHYPPNADAAIHLVRDIFPLVQTAIASAELWIVGRDPTQELVRTAAGLPGVTITGYVSDMRPYFDRATVFAAPLRFGAGIQNKVLEAMAMGLPVIASPSAAAGVCTLNGREPPVRVAGGTEAFAWEIVRQLRSRALGQTQLRDYVARHFSWKRSGDTLHRILCQVAEDSCTRTLPKNGSAKQPCPQSTAVPPLEAVPALITTYD